MFIRLVLLCTFCLACDSTAAQDMHFVDTGNDTPGSIATMTADRVATGPLSIPLCTRSTTRKVICGGLSTSFGLYIAVPSAIIFHRAVRRDVRDDPYGVIKRLNRHIILSSAVLFGFGSIVTYYGVDLLIDAFRPPTKYAFRPVAGSNGPGLSIRIHLP